MVYGKGAPDLVLSDPEVKKIIEAGTPATMYENKRVLVLTPDATRTCPLPMMIRAIREIIGNRCAKLDFIVALGTHPVMPEESLLKLYGIDSEDRAGLFENSAFLNHRWDRPNTFQRIGYFEAEEIDEISGGRLKERIPIDINRKIFDYDLILILGPVFPHEVVGFSGGAKYLFPGISGGDFLHFFHWLGAVITCSNIIGIKKTPVRELIHRAMGKIEVPIHCISMVVTRQNKLCSLYAGDVVKAWSNAADVSARLHVMHKKAPYRIVFGRSPEMYDEIWVAGKVMYKLEQVVADGGKLIIYGPHISEVSRTWGEYIEKVGYHVRDYFLNQMDRFEEIPKGVLAHSTHVRGTGTYENGVEKPRIDVVLATSIPKETCDRISLGYMDPNGVRVEDYMNREDEGILFVDHAGEILYKIAS